ncbi:MAG: MerP protein [Flavobacteriales bacterium]|nr:MAG: MerP protein [Flavobacteriales bacterium]
MKKTIKTMLLLLMVGFAISASAQKKTESIEIKTSAQCGMCKKKIEDNVSFAKGVKTAVLDMETKMLTVNYKTAKTTPEKIREAVSKLGYDADNVVADAEVYQNLPACCKKDGGH